MIQHLWSFTRQTYRDYKDVFLTLLYAALLLKLGARWSASIFGMIFFPAMFIILLRMDVMHKLFVLVYLLPFSESVLIPRMMFGIRGFNFVNIVFLLVLFSMLKRSGSLFQRSSYNAAIGFFVLLNLISAIRGFDVRQNLGLGTMAYFMQSFLKPMQILMCGLMAFNIFKKPEDPYDFLKAIKLGSLMMGIWIIYRGGLGDFESMRRLARVTGLHKNSAGFMFTILLAVNLATENFGDKNQRILSRILSVLYITVIMFTFSRQGYVTCVALLFLHSLKKGWKSAAVFMAGLALFWVYFMPFEVKQRIYYGSEKGVMMGLKDYTMGDTTAGRKEAWEASAELMREHPMVRWIGEGKYTYLKHLQYERPDLPVHPHNAYIQCVLDMGILGAVPFIGFYVFLMMKSFFLWRRSRSRFASAFGYGYLLAVMAFMLSAYTGFRFWPYEESYYLWFLLGVLMWVDKSQNYLADHGM